MGIILLLPWFLSGTGFPLQISLITSLLDWVKTRTPFSDCIATMYLESIYCSLLIGYILFDFFFLGSTDGDYSPPMSPKRPRHGSTG